ncbi:MAG: helix-turn-helix domain-containing protein [Chitinispirillaceae bacterium]
MKNRFLPKTLIFPAAAVISAILLSFLLHSFLRPLRSVSLTVYPDRTVDTSPIEDSYEGGNSKVLQFKQDSVLSFSYTLKSGFKYPYAGANLKLGPCDTCGIDFSPFDSIALTISSPTDDAIRVFLKGYDRKLYSNSDPTSYIYREIEYVPSSDTATRTFALEDFSYPTWWKINRSVDTELPHSLKKVSFIELFSGFSRSNRDTVDVTLSKIELRGENRKISLFLILGFMIFWSIPVAIICMILIKGIRRKLQHKHNRLKMLQKSKRVDIHDPASDPGSRILEYIAAHFTDPELDLTSVAHGAGVARNRVTEEIRKQLNTTFKGYLNDLRLHEAARLLKESSRQITEIALAVGFNNVSHFNRLFKEQFKVSPRKYRTSETLTGKETAET